LQRDVINLWSSILRVVSERLNGGSGRVTSEAAPAAPEPREAAADRQEAGATPARPWVPEPIPEPTPAPCAGALGTPDPAAVSSQCDPAPEPASVPGPNDALPEPATPVVDPVVSASAAPSGVGAIVPQPQGPVPAAPAVGLNDPAPAGPVSVASLPLGIAGLEEELVKAYQWAQSKFVGGVTELVLLTPITPGPIPGERRTYEERLRAELGSIQRRVDRGLNTPINIIPTIHFAGWLILRPEQYLQGAAFPRTAPPVLDPYTPADQAPTHDYRFRTWLFFTSYFDGDLKDYLREFSNFLGKDVDRVWGNCEGYPEGGSMDFEAFWQYAKRYQIEGVGDLLDKFILENQAYTGDFPAIGGTYDVDQSNRNADLRKS
jgi:hypothetical protein